MYPMNMTKLEVVLSAIRGEICEGEERRIYSKNAATSWNV